jgi:large subunit ribosomal protein L35
MPKVKTNKSAAKRFRKTATGKFKRNRAYSRHLKSAKTSKCRRGLRHSVVVSAQDEPAVRQMLPYA